MFNNLSNRLVNTIKNFIGPGCLTESNIKNSLEQIRIALLEADVALPVVNSFLAAVRTKAIGQEHLKNLDPSSFFVKIVYDELVHILGNVTVPLKTQTKLPTIILLVGLQGSGKTTTAAKLAAWLQEQQKQPLLVSVDYYRPAAIEQLAQLAQQLALPIFPTNLTSSAIPTIQQAVQQAKIQQSTHLIIDTAGRLHIDNVMMNELVSIQQAIQPDEILLVVDSMIGQDAVKTAETFSTTLPLTGTILTKTDGDARGGAALSMRMITQQPIKFIGTGEKIAAFEIFHPDRIASRILDMGDILTLVEEAHRKVDHEKAKKLAHKLQKGHGFNLEDFRAQLEQMRKMGGATSFLSKLPGFGNITQKVESLQGGEQLLSKMEVIINSMTKKERQFPAFIKGSHKQRIARGSGSSIQEVNRLLKQFTQLQKTMLRLNGSKIAGLMQKLQGMLR